MLNLSNSIHTGLKYGVVNLILGSWKGSAAMTHHECKSLVDHLAAKVERGLVDIKFFVRSGHEISTSQVCSEAGLIFDAIERGAVEEYSPKDSNRSVAQD
jgi:hypothetical protein